MASCSKLKLRLRPCVMILKPIINILSSGPNVQEGRYPQQLVSCSVYTIILLGLIVRYLSIAWSLGLSIHKTKAFEGASLR